MHQGNLNNSHSMHLQQFTNFEGNHFDQYQFSSKIEISAGCYNDKNETTSCDSTLKEDESEDPWNDLFQ